MIEVPCLRLRVRAPVFLAAAILLGTLAGCTDRDESEGHEDSDAGNAGGTGGEGGTSGDGGSDGGDEDANPCACSHPTYPGGPANTTLKCLGVSETWKFEDAAKEFPDACQRIVEPLGIANCGDLLATVIGLEQAIWGTATFYDATTLLGVGALEWEDVINENQPCSPNRVAGRTAGLIRCATCFVCERTAKPGRLCKFDANGDLIVPDFPPPDAGP